MIKIERKTTVKSEKAIESLEKAKQSNASYNTSEVNAALQEMFHKKCYICENNNITSYQIEHLIPHKGDMTLKYDWNNLFLSCAHCNNTKLGKYDPILDCTKEAEDEDKEDLRCLIKEELGEKSSFTAFKRWLIRDNRESFPELAIGL